MQTLKSLALLLSISIFGACVQKSGNKTVVFILDAGKAQNIKTVGVRGGNRPLNWDGDLEMLRVGSDSTYRATATFLTGYKFTEVKFVVNGQFELQESGNRRVMFSERDTTEFRAVFDVAN